MNHCLCYPVYPPQLSLSTLAARCLNTKLDKLLEFLPDQRGRTRHSTEAPRSRRPLPYAEFESELRRAEPKFYTEKGKDLVRDFSIESPWPRPHMFIDRPGVRTQKEKLAMRESMSFTDYVIGFTSMLLDPRTRGQDDWHSTITHLNQVANDAYDRPWHCVRGWSDHVFSRLENG